MKWSADPGSMIIKQPTRILWGEADPVILAAWSDRVQEYFPDVSLRILPGVGHFVPFEAPDEILAEIAKLNLP
nr:alpha/beta hydrolase [Effusibacillus dendaii]